MLGSLLGSREMTRVPELDNNNYNTKLFVAVAVIYKLIILHVIIVRIVTTAITDRTVKKYNYHFQLYIRINKLFLKFIWTFPYGAPHKSIKFSSYT